VGLVARVEHDETRRTERGGVREETQRKVVEEQHSPRKHPPELSYCRIRAAGERSCASHRLILPWM
jgi:hypothetical protein